MGAKAHHQSTGDDQRRSYMSRDQTPQVAGIVEWANQNSNGFSRRGWIDPIQDIFEEDTSLSRSRDKSIERLESGNNDEDNAPRAEE